MSGRDWNAVFKLPQTALADSRRIPKTVLVKQALLTKTEQKVLDKVRRLELFATVQKSTTRISPYVDEGRDIQSVLFLRCEMARSEAFGEVAALLHKCFPNPTVILFEGPDSACISVAVTRKSLAEKGAVVVDTVRSTGRFSPDDESYGPFLDSLAFEGLSQENLLAFLGDIDWNVRLSRAIGSVGFMPVCDPRDRQRLEALLASQNELTERLADARRRHGDKNLTLNESARVRMEMKGLERELGTVAGQIKELCHG